MFGLVADGVPAHMRQRQAVCVEYRGARGQDTEGGYVAFGGVLAEQLHAEADAQKRLLRATNGVGKAARGDVVHGSGSGADAGQEQFVGGGDGNGVGADAGTAAETGKGGLHGEEVGTAGVDDDEVGHGCLSDGTGFRNVIPAQAGTAFGRKSTRKSCCGEKSKGRLNRGNVGFKNPTLYIGTPVS